MWAQLQWVKTMRLIVNQVDKVVVVDVIVKDKVLLLNTLIGVTSSLCYNVRLIIFIDNNVCTCN